MMQAQVQCVQWLQVEVQGEKGAYLVGVWGVCFARGKRAATMLRREEEEERRRWCRRVAQSMREGDGSARGCGEGICAWAMRWKEGDGDGGMGLGCCVRTWAEMKGGEDGRAWVMRWKEGDGDGDGDGRAIPESSGAKS
ncbi:hypothetical protein AAC387_Pa12g0336 [Persea americana]